jgi:tRNA-splicing ligase RtcB (3'-phosphate/5'-hydroxy nucleic acid ligase)
MTSSTIHGGHVPIRLWARPQDVEPEALQQLKRVAALPWVAHHVAVMPDVHVGKGATVGSVIALRDAVAPAAVGVDMGCGMAALETNIDASHLPDSLRSIRLAIEAAVPVGRAQHDEPAWATASPDLQQRAVTLLSSLAGMAPLAARHATRASRQLATLGGGNHFIELCLDTEQKLWVLLHTGSRFIGAALAHNRALSDPSLGVFLAGTRVFDAYRRDLDWAQNYAALNRELILHRLKQLLKQRFPRCSFLRSVACHHNYLAEERHFGERLLITRKGAIRAGQGELGIIPGSMGAKSFVVRGLGNPLSFESASHGAGRRLSRSAARRNYDVTDLARQTAGVECRKDAGVLDEAPSAYKNIEQVLAAQADLVQVEVELKQIVCVKG